MTTGKKTRTALKGRFSPAKVQRQLSVGQSVRIARALRVHPAVLLFPGWRTGDESAA
ncbi:MAG: hypothetical protein WBM75_01975 [Polyangiales bacterium]